MRILAIVLLILCVHCKMVDLDCAFNNPLHCQTLFESGDNTPGHLDVQPALPALTVTVQVLRQRPAVAAAPVPLPDAPAPPRPFLTSKDTLMRPPPRVG